MPTKTKDCEKCGEATNAWPSNRKYCPACQAHRDLAYRPGLRRECDVCSTEFWPFRTSHTTCPRCATFNLTDESRFPECGNCGENNRTAPGLTSTCVVCVTSTRDSQKAYLTALQRRLHRIQSEKESN